MKKVTVVCSSFKADCFTPMLRKGVGLAVATGFSVRSLLTSQFNLEDDYVTGRIRTIFLDGHPVDDIDVAKPGEGSVLALGAAMPGLVGITMGVASPFKAMRGEINYDPNTVVPESNGMITLKLFNIVAQEIGCSILERGVTVSAELLGQVLTDEWSYLKPVVKEIHVDAITLEEPDANSVCTAMGDGEVLFTIAVE